MDWNSGSDYYGGYIFLALFIFIILILVVFWVFSASAAASARPQTTIRLSVTRNDCGLVNGVVLEFLNANGTVASVKTIPVTPKLDESSSSSGDVVDATIDLAAISVAP